MNWIKYILTLLLLYFGMGARADNIVTIGTAEGAPGDEVTMSIGLQNTDALSSLQVSIPLGENLTLVEGSAQVGSRCDGHVVNAGVNDGTLQLVVYSLSMATIAPGDGEVASFKLKLGNEPVSFSLKPNKMVLTDGSGKTTSASSQNGNVTIRCPKAQFGIDEIDFGRVPIRSTYTGEVAVTNVGNADLVVSDLEFSDVNVFSTTTQLPKTIAAGQTANFNVTYAPVERGIIERQVRIVSNSATRIRAIKLKAQPYAVNELHIGNASGVSDEEVTISMRMNNMDEISGYQLDFNLPSSLQYVDGSFILNEERKQDHVGAASIVDGQLRIVVYSPSGKPLKDNDGEIGTFRVKLVGKYGVNLKPTKTVLTATINSKVENVVSDVYGGQITIQYPSISTSGDIDYGAVSVTEECKKTFAISNYGSAPLTVSRIIFNDENLSVEEEMPLVIPSWGNKNVTVLYSGMEQKAFESTMQIYNNDPDRRLHEVKVRGSRFAPNYMGLSIPNIFEEEMLKVNLAVNSYDNITGLQFDMIYPNNLFETFDNNVQLDERANGMTVSSRQISNNTIRYVCYFLGGGSIAAGNGDVMTISLKPVGDITPVGTYSVDIKNVKLGTAELAEKYAGTDLNGSFKVKKHNPVTITAKSYTRQYGDANPTFEYTSEGAAVVGKPAFSCEATATSPVGEYPIVISKGGVTNEEDTYVNGVLTITKTPLKISVGNYEKKQYDPMPEFTVSFEGFKNDETESVLSNKPVISCDANEDSAPGEYAITLSGAEAANYQIQYVAGTLTVTEPDSYTLTYMVDGEVYQSFSIKYRDVITPLAVPIKEGYTFSGWSEIPATMPAKDVTVTGSFAVNSYSLTYMVDGEVYKTSPIPYGTTLTPESDPTKEGYTFSGWSEIPSTMPAKDVTVTGTFTINSYTLTYMVDGEVYQSFIVNYKEAITPLDAPKKEGYTFSGWDGLPRSMPAKDVVVKGYFTINSYTITYVLDGEVYTTETLEYGAKIVPPVIPGLEDYTIWEDVPATMPASDITIYGKAKDIIDSLTSVFSRGEGEVYDSSGRKLPSLQKGLNIIRMKDGTVKKIIFK